MMQMQQQRNGRARTKAQGRDHRQPGDRFQCMIVKHVVQRRNHKGPGHKSRDERVEHNHDAPRDMRIVGEDEFRTVHQTTSPDSPT